MATDEPFLGFATFTVAPKPLNAQNRNLLGKTKTKKPLILFKIVTIKMWEVFQTCAYSTTKNTNFFKRGCRVDLGDGTNMTYSIFTEGRGTKKVIYWLSILGEPGLAITEHSTPVSVDPQEITHVAFLWLTVPALLALPREHRKDMVSWLEISHTLTYAFHNSKQKIAKQAKFRKLKILCLQGKLKI